MKNSNVIQNHSKHKEKTHFFIYVSQLHTFGDHLKSPKHQTLTHHSLNFIVRD